MKDFLITFQYEGWNQGRENMWETLLVRAESFEQAVHKIINDSEYADLKFIENKTIE